MPMVRFPLRSSWTIPESDRAPMRSSVAVKALSKADTCPWCDAIHAGLQKKDCAPTRSLGAVKELWKADTCPWCDPSPLLRFLLRSSWALQKNNCTPVLSCVPQRRSAKGGCIPVGTEIGTMGMDRTMGRVSALLSAFRAPEDRMGRAIVFL